MRRLIAAAAVLCTVVAPPLSGRAAVPIPVNCTATATLENDWGFAEANIWKLVDGSGSCAQVLGPGRWHVTFAGDGGPVDSDINGGAFFLAIDLTLVNDVTGQVRHLSHSWKGVSLPCTPVGRFLITSRNGATLPHGVGNLKFCQEFGEVRVPASVTWTFLLFP